MPGEREAHWQRLSPKTGVSQHPGADTILELDCHGQTLQARVNPGSSYPPNRADEMHLNITRYRLFDHETEQVL